MNSLRSAWTPPLAGLKDPQMQAKGDIRSSSYLDSVLRVILSIELVQIIGQVTCIGWFDVKEVRANRKQAMRFCLTNNNFAARGQGARRASYDACMNQNDIVTALCTQELNVRAALDRNYRGQVYSCPAAAPASYGESAVVLQGGHEDTVPLMIAAPGLPPLLQAPLPKGLLRGGTPLPKR